ncbi:MAG TPA: peptide-methionine (S)-S-oxide reductase MsrA [Bryobacteraceae bacterium]|nr:peptide-methionine (S)-S-oxide reductase MsrA [Bryobacteraceae bacterium]
MYDHLAQVLLAGIVLLAFNAQAAPFPDPKIDDTRAPQKSIRKAVFAGGCFWCTEAVFEYVDGVDKVVSVYSGGTKETADYESVSTGRTAHAEAIEISYDASKITYGQLLKVFFEIAHDPTTLNRQGPDTGPQYRSAVFALDANQKRIVQSYIAQLDAAKAFRSKIVTEVADFKAFYEAEGYHQNYCTRNPRNPYVMFNAQPKVEKLKKSKPGLLKKK